MNSPQVFQLVGIVILGAYHFKVLGSITEVSGLLYAVGMSVLTILCISRAARKLSWIPDYQKEKEKKKEISLDEQGHS